MSSLAVPALVHVRLYTITAQFFIFTVRVVSGSLAFRLGVFPSISTLRMCPFSVHRVSSWWRVSTSLFLSIALSVTLSVMLLLVMAKCCLGFFPLAISSLSVFRVFASVFRVFMLTNG